MNMKTKTIILAAIIIAATAALAIAPALSTNSALAKKSCHTGESNHPCNDTTKTTPAGHCTNPKGKPVNCHGS